MLLPSSAAPTDSHTSRQMERTNVLDTEILNRTKRCLGTPLAFSLSSDTWFKVLLGGLDLHLGDNMARKRVQETHSSLCQMQQGSLADVTKHVNSPFHLPEGPGGPPDKMPKAILCSAIWGHLTRCCQFDDGTRQLAEIT